MNKIEPANLGRGQFHFLVSRAPNRVFISIVAGILGGAAYALLIPLILLSIAPVDPVLSDFIEKPVYSLWGWQIEHPKFALAFVTLCVFALLARAGSQIAFSNVTVSATTELRLYFSERIRRMPIPNLEALGSSRLMSAVTLDIARLVEGAAVLPVLLINTSTIVCALTFIGWLDRKIFLLVLAVLLLGVASYRLPVLLAQWYFTRARERRDDAQESLRAQVYGAKELKLNAAKYDEFMSAGMRADEAAIIRYMNRGNTILHLSIQYGNLIGFFAIGVISYCAAGRYGLDTQLLVSIVMAMLYIIGPIGIIVNAVPTLVQGTVALNKLRELLESMQTEQLVEGGEPLVCRELRLDAVTYSYPNADGFEVGPVSLTLKRGQVTFIVGGNGSGKSTLAKLISCHYVPSAGRVLYDGEPVDETTLFRARQGISAIYLDFYLFSHLFGHGAADLQRASAYLEQLGLAHKVRMDGNRFSTTDLSDGQRKRLALLVAFMADRNLYVFDEWAADQDPEFKNVFYTGLLAELRRQNKIVVVISHDDRYFDQADQLVRMQHGAVTAVEQRSMRSQCEMNVDAQQLRAASFAESQSGYTKSIKSM